GDTPRARWWGGGREEGERKEKTGAGGGGAAGDAPRGGKARPATPAPGSRSPTDRPRHWPSSGLLAGRTVTPEISGCRILPGLYDAATDRARFAEELVQGVAVTKANGALQRGQVFAEAPQHLQHRLLVVE